MRIRVKAHAKLQPDKMAKIALAATPRALLDLYCVAPGQDQKPHTHGDQDKFYVVLEGRGRFRLGAPRPTPPGRDAPLAGPPHHHRRGKQTPPPPPPPPPVGSPPPPPLRVARRARWEIPP